MESVYVSQEGRLTYEASLLDRVHLYRSLRRRNRVHAADRENAGLTPGRDIHHARRHALP